MGQPHNLTVTLSDEAVEFIRRKVSSGQYASESDVIDESLKALKAETEERERWEREIVVPSYERVMADPSSAIPLEKVERDLEVGRRQRSQIS